MSRRPNERTPSFSLYDKSQKPPTYVGDIYDDDIRDNNPRIKSSLINLQKSSIDVGGINNSRSNDQSFNNNRNNQKDSNYLLSQSKDMTSYNSRTTAPTIKSTLYSQRKSSTKDEYNSLGNPRNDTPSLNNRNNQKDSNYLLSQSKDMTPHNSRPNSSNSRHVSGLPNITNNNANITEVGERYNDINKKLDQFMNDQVKTNKMNQDNIMKILDSLRKQNSLCFDIIEKQDEIMTELKRTNNITEIRQDNMHSTLESFIKNQNLTNNKVDDALKEIKDEFRKINQHFNKVEKENHINLVPRNESILKNSNEKVKTILPNKMNSLNIRESTHSLQDNKYSSLSNTYDKALNSGSNKVTNSVIENNNKSPRTKYNSNIQENKSINRFTESNDSDSIKNTLITKDAHYSDDQQRQDNIYKAVNVPTSNKDIFNELSDLNRNNKRSSSASSQNKPSVTINESISNVYQDINSLSAIPQGLSNPAGYCYLNCVIQLLRSCSEFCTKVEYYHKESAIVHSQGNDDEKIFVNDFCKLIVELRRSFSSKIQDNLSRIQIHFRDEGDDIMQCFMKLLTKIHSVTNTKKHLGKTGSIRNKTPQEAFEFYQSRNSGFVFDYFYGIMSNKFECKTCKTCLRSSYQLFKTLTLPVPITDRKVPLSECLDSFFRSSRVEDAEDFKCKCANSNIKEFYSTSTISYGPRYLFIYLNRGSYFENRPKINTFVTMDTFIKIPVSAESSLKYKLISVVDHLGNNEYGHYYVKSCFEESSWYSLNDSSILRIYNVDDIVKKNTAVFLLKKMD